MKNKLFLASVAVIFLLGLVGCTFYPVVPQAEYEARLTAQAVVPLPTVTPTPDCTVKGNINSKGEKIYHLPGDPNYAKTIPEACFSDTASAEAAGYRPIKK